MAGGDKTEQPTPRRRSQARERGQVARSADLNTAVVLLASVLMLRVMGERLFHMATGFLSLSVLEMDARRITDASAMGVGVQLFLEMAMLLMPFLLIVTVAGSAITLTQVGFKISFHPLAPDLSRINPITGMQRFFALRSLVDLGRNLIKLFFIAIAVFFILRAHVEELTLLSTTDVRTGVLFLMRVLYEIGWKLGLLLLVLAILDYAYQRWEHERNLKMTKQEVREELKQTEGSPDVKRRVKERQREIARRIMMKAVPEADVVITNPTHYAVALRYDSRTMNAPTVVAKGEGLIAQRIKELAKEHDVPVVENRPLAQTLYRTVEIGDEVPSSLYKAVAEVLAFVYRLKGKVPA